MIVYESFYVFLLVGSNTVGLTGAMQLQHLQSYHPEKYNIPTNNSINIGGNIDIILTLVVKGIPAGITIIYKKLLAASASCKRAARE